MRRASDRVIKAVAVTCELTGTEVSPDAARIMAHDLAAYPDEQVIGALTKCRKELRGRLTIADIVDRLDDGRPGPEEAWAECPRAESDSVVWSEEQRDAWAAAMPLLAMGETIQARMTFIEVYRRKCREAREVGKVVAWTPSLGTDAFARETALINAVEKGRLNPQAAYALLPSVSFQQGRELPPLLAAAAPALALDDKSRDVGALTARAGALVSR